MVRRSTGGLFFMAALLALGVYPRDSLAQGEPRKNDVVVLRIPRSLLTYHDYLTLPGNTVYTGFVATVEARSGQTTVEGRKDWRLAGFPVATEWRVAMVRKKDDQGTVRLEREEKEEKQRVRLTILGDLAAGFAAVTAPAGRSGAVREEAYRLLADHMFTGPLSTLEPSKRFVLLTYADAAAASIRIASELYKGQAYMVVDLGRDQNVYNDLQLNHPSESHECSIVAFSP